MNYKDALPPLHDEPIPMRIVHARPPAHVWDGCDRQFGVSKRFGVIFAYRDIIYNPDGVTIPAPLLAHEGVHGARQDAMDGGVIDWWERYLAEPAFRLAEEIPAHVAELRVHLGQAILSRPARRLLIAAVAKRLASPLYGRLISADHAKRLLKDALHADSERVVGKSPLLGAPYGSADAE